MKSGIPLLAATGLAALFHFSSAQAIPLYYSFEGTVASYPISDSSGFLGDIGVAAGDSVSYTFMVDKDRQGTYLNQNGEVVEDQDAVYPNGSSPLENYILHDSFYVELVESSVFDLVQSVYSDRGNDEPWTGSGYGNSEYRNGLLDPGGNNEVSLAAGSTSIGSSSFYLYSDMSNWQIGSTVSNDNTTTLYGNQPGESSQFHSQLTLTGISEFDPTNADASFVLSEQGEAGFDEETSTHNVPEPSTFLLLGLGLLSIGAGRYRKLG
jgi:hypothetical protein